MLRRPRYAVTLDSEPPREPWRVESMTVDPASSAKNDAVVVAREVVARSADSIHSPARFARPLPTGTEVEILESRDTWSRIALANGREAWVRTSSFSRVLR